jgi:glutathione synthase/RimK-type ligase-like ATP-grasp enzyme
VIDHLSRAGVVTQRLNIEAATTTSAMAWSPDMIPPAVVVWWRQFEADTPVRSLADADDLLVSRAQWRTWLSTLDTPASRWMNPLWSARRAESKVEQLRVARALGFDLPATLVTNDRTEAANFQQAVGDVVVKTLASAYFEFSNQAFVFTESLDHPALDDPNAWFGAPVIVQKRLVGAADARIVSFGDSTFAARSANPGLDWRKLPFDPEMWECCVPPIEIVDYCRRYRAHLSLEYAAFDFMVSEDVWWFLEANQAGEFSFIDRALDLGIAESLARHLAALAESDD